MAELRILSESEFNKIFTTTNYEDATSSSDKQNNKINYHDHDDLVLEKISVESYKKSDKIYYHNDDHTYAKNIIIDRVDDDCLAEIFMYLPICERPKVALVCKKWQRALDDSWFNVKKLELIYWRWDEYPNCLAEYSTSDGGFCLIKSLLNKCGRYLTKLDLTAYGDYNIVPVINDSCPNLVKLRLRFTHIYEVILANSFIRLSKLKSLTIIFQNIKQQFISTELVYSFLDVANTLTDLILLNFIDCCFDLEDYCAFPEEIDCVIPELKALKKFEVAGINCSPDLLKYLTDNKVFISNYYRYYCQELELHNFRFYTKLDLSHYRVTDDSLYTIANMFTVKVLYIFCEWVTDDGVVAISKMKELHILEFIGRNNITDSSIKLLKNLTKLKLPISNKITDVSVTKVLENSPYMNELYVKDTGVTVEFIKKAADISKNRKQLLRLFYSSDTFIPDIEQYESRYFDIYMIQKEEQKITSDHENSLFIENVRVHFL